MHLMLGPAILCRLLSNDPRLAPDARDYMDRAQRISVPAMSLTAIWRWHEEGRLTGDPAEVLKTLMAQGIPVIGLGASTYQTLANNPRLAGATNAPMNARLIVAQALTESAILLTEDREQARLAPSNTLWSPSTSLSEKSHEQYP